MLAEPARAGAASTSRCRAASAVPLSARSRRSARARRRWWSRARRSSRRRRSASISRRGMSLGHAVDAIRERGSKIGHARRRSRTDFRGAAGAFQSALQQRTAAGARGDRRRLYRAGRALRKLHPPADDPLDAALGRGRRAARAATHRLWPRRDRHHRHRAADRHRQEERDHDDRLRARGDARARAWIPSTRSARRRCCASARS